MNVYERALRVLDERGWAQGRDVDTEGRVCLAKALQLAVADVTIWYDSCKSLERFLDLRGISLASWNDHPHTTEEDVRLLLKRAAVELAS